MQENIKKIMNNFILPLFCVIGVISFIILTNIEYHMFYSFSDENVQLFLNQDMENIYKDKNSINYIFYGSFFVFFAFMFITIKVGSFIMIKFVNKKTKTRWIKSFYAILILLFSFVSAMYMAIYAINSVFDLNKYNHGYIEGNTPILSSGIGIEKRQLLVSKNGLLFKEDNYFERIIGEELNYSEMLFLSMLEGTYLSYSEFIKNTNIENFTIDDKIWLYENHILNFKKLHTKLIKNNKNKDESYKIYTELLENDINKYKDLNILTYEIKEKECKKINKTIELIEDNKGTFCHLFKKHEKDSSINLTREKLENLKKLYNKNKGKVKYEKNIVSFKDINDFMVNK